MGQVWSPSIQTMPLTCCQSLSELSKVTLASSGTKPVFKLLKAHMVFVTGITFSKDTKHVLSASADASARLTDISPGSLRIATKGEGGQPELARCRGSGGR